VFFRVFRYFRGSIRKVHLILAVLRCALCGKKEQSNWLRMHFLVSAQPSPFAAFSDLLGE
jgi:hypothetical protein